MRLALLSDVHGNRHALEAVVADAQAQDVDSWWVLGDLAAIGPDPVATVALIADLPGVQVIAGNTDRYALTADRPFPQADDVRARPELLELYAEVQRSFAWTGGALAGSGWRGWLEALPASLRTTLPDGTRVLGVHATPGSDDGAGITPHRDAAELAEDLDGCHADVVFAGHTHQPTDRVVGGVRAVNLGGVSNPIVDDLRASYVVLHADEGGHRIEHRWVGYDRDAFLASLARSGHPAADYIASFQRGEQVRFAAVRPGAP